VRRRFRNPNPFLAGLRDGAHPDRAGHVEAMRGLTEYFIRRFLRQYRRPRVPRGAMVLVFGGAIERRMAAAAELRRFSPKGYVLTGLPREVAALRAAAVQHGIDTGRLIDEPRATTTMSNARNCARLLWKHRGPVILVTDDWHMPRSAWLCRWYGLRPILWCAPGFATEATIQREARVWWNNGLTVVARSLVSGGRG